MKLVTPPTTPTTNPPGPRVPTTSRRGAGALHRQARSAVAAYLILGSGGALGAAVACGSDEATVEDGGDATGNPAGRGNSASGNSGGSANAGTGGGSASGSGAGTGGAATSGAGSENAAGADAAPVEEFSFFPECSTGESSEPCAWSLSPEFTGASCTPGEPLILGCCDCGSSRRADVADPVLRVCDGSMSCSESAAIGFADDGCQFCPVLEFTCPASGVYSALVGSYPQFEVDEQGNPTQGAAPPNECQPKLIDASNSGAFGSDAGTPSFDDIHPVLLTNCGRCHAEDTGLGSLLALPPFASSDIEAAFEAARGFGIVILAQINSGVMPPDTCDGAPGSTGCVSAEDFELLRKWYASGSPR